MKNHLPATNSVEMAFLNNRQIELQQEIAIAQQTVREGGYFAETAAEQIPELEAELRSARLAYDATPKHWDGLMENYMFGVAPPPVVKVSDRPTTIQYQDRNGKVREKTFQTQAALERWSAKNEGDVTILRYEVLA